MARANLTFTKDRVLSTQDVDIEENGKGGKLPFPKMATMSMQPALCAPELTRDMDSMLGVGVSARLAATSSRAQTCVPTFSMTGD